MSASKGGSSMNLDAIDSFVNLLAKKIMIHRVWLVCTMEGKYSTISSLTNCRDFLEEKTSQGAERIAGRTFRDGAYASFELPMATRILFLIHKLSRLFCAGSKPSKMWEAASLL